MKTWLTSSAGSKEPTFTIAYSIEGVESETHRRPRSDQRRYTSTRRQRNMLIFQLLQSGSRVPSLSQLSTALNSISDDEWLLSVLPVFQLYTDPSAGFYATRSTPHSAAITSNPDLWSSRCNELMTNSLCHSRSPTR